MKNRKLQILSTGTALAAVLCVLSARNATYANDADPTHSSKTLAVLQNVYWDWQLGQISLAPDADGNPVMGGNIALMPIPSAPGDGTPASIRVALQSGQEFFLPLWNLLGNSYTNGSQDGLIPLKVFQTLDIQFKIDGETILDRDEVMDHYSQFYFNPAIPFNSPPVTAWIWLQGVSILHGPLAPGKHVLKLDVKNTDTKDLFGLTIEYHNTWNVTVKP